MTIPAVAVVAYPGFSPFHLSVPCIIFGDVLPGQALFRLEICAAEPGPIRSVHGLSLSPAAGVEGLAAADIVIVPGWDDPALAPPPELAEALRAAHARGAQVVGLCLGTYVLAYAGLLDGRRASTHWEFEQDFLLRFPQVRLDTNALYVDEDRLITSAGTAAGVDCCLYLVRQHYGSVIANKIARRMVVPTYREGGQAQFIEKPVPASTQDIRINEQLDFLRQNLSVSHSLDTLAARANMSRRSFTRYFQRATGMSVGEWVLTERLRRTQELLEVGTQPIETIAEQVGFGTAASLRQHFKHAFGVTPVAWRKRFNRGVTASVQTTRTVLP
ncbi:helix-turn-helix domain-containing protein [Thauera aromatica]|uniref:GlxA family transcriptional regulator n=1 Tax=Thauera aromatica TaxID=59405 RepID=UPI001FFD9632|nr:helix-turn-helix domain-containing protein [Thauera aromatica]MCK2088591.1 helix-turn-helix domain-containing protein [Thauera aromatica]